MLLSLSRFLCYVVYDADPHFYLNKTSLYFFRAGALRHLRLEQYNRYYAATDEGGAASTLEDTCCDQGILSQPDHKNYDEWSESVPEGTRIASSMKSAEGVRRRHQSRLAVNRSPTLEPIAGTRERFYEQRLLLGLSWYCSSPPTSSLAVDGKVNVTWTFTWTPLDELATQLLPQELVLGPDVAVSFETVCADLEKEFTRRKHDLVCTCCALEEPEQKCKSCVHCVGFHRCTNEHVDTRRMLWRKGSLHAGDLDIQRVLYNLHRKHLPTEVLRDKSQEYVAANLLTLEKANLMMRAIEQERDAVRTVNEVDSDEEAPQQRESLCTRLSQAEMEAELERREQLMRTGKSSGVTDQWRVYTGIINGIRIGSPLRLMVQASAGTGKSFLLTTVYLWCIVNGKKAQGCAPTGIAAANVEIPGTEVNAITIHNLLDLDGDLQTKLDFAKLGHPKVARLMSLEVLFIDEVSMIDVDCWSTISTLFSIIDHSKRPQERDADSFGDLHVLLFGSL